MKIHAHTIRRDELERKILTIFKALNELPEFGERGIGKDSIKRTLMMQAGQRSMSINTVKRIVDRFVEEGTVECVNPNNSTNLRFRLVMGVLKNEG